MNNTIDNTTELGAVIKELCCPEQYYSTETSVKKSIPKAILMYIFASSTSYAGVGNVFPSIFSGIAFALITFLIFYKSYKRMMNTYICVCENGVYGVYRATRFVNRSFSVPYSDIKSVIATRDDITIKTAESKITVNIPDSYDTESLINKKINEYLSRLKSAV